MSSKIIDNMPLVTDDPFAVKDYENPVEQRDAVYKRFLSVSVKIAVPGATGSGTIVYYDDKTKYAYVQSCGHLWPGSMSSKENKNITCKVICWYHNNEKLKEPLTYKAEVLYYNNNRGRDSSLLRFKSDWKPNYFPIAHSNYVIRQGQVYNSCGCDNGTEVARYAVEAVGFRDVGVFKSLTLQDLITVRNSPRPGRSGGGLMSNDGYYIGICWGTSAYNGTGNGYFTPLPTIRMMNELEGFGFLNNIGQSNLAQRIPIIDRNNPQRKYPGDYIPLPRF